MWWSLPKGRYKRFQMEGIYNERHPVELKLLALRKGMEREKKRVWDKSLPGGK